MAFLLPRNSGLPTIPLHHVDAPSQRVYAFGTFALLQAMKIYQVMQWQLSSSSSSTNFELALQWILIDFAFIILLAYMRIPWLTFPLPAMLVQAILLSIINTLICAKLTVSLSWIVPSIFRALFDYQTGILEKRVVIQDIIINATHIQGRHVIHIRPHSSAVINPGNKCYCVGFDNPKVLVPIVFNNTDVEEIEMLRAQQDGSIQDSTFPASMLIKSDREADSKDAGKSIRYFPIDAPGHYKLQRVKDRSGRLARVIKGHSALVVACPSVTLEGGQSTSWRDPVDEHTCVGAQAIQTKFVVQGFAPLEVNYSRIINGAREHKQITQIFPPQLTQRALMSEWSMDTEALALTWDDTQALETYSQTTIPLNFTFNHPQEYIIQLDSVRDACGNVLDLDYLRKMDRGRPEGIVEERLIKVHKHPSVRFTSCDPFKPVNLVEGESAELTIRLERGEAETSPVEVQVTRLDFDGSDGQIASFSPDALRNLAGKESYVYNLKPKDDKAVLKISKPGIYTITEAQDKYCTGDIKEPSQCFVLPVPKPKAEIKFEPITDACAGEVGVKAHMLLTGEPPFEIGYYVRYPATWSQPQNLLRKYEKVTIHKTRYDLDLRPRSSGTHTYHFADITDKNYRNVKIDFSTTQNVFPASEVKFITSPHSQIRACVEEKVTAEVEFEGIGPWKLEYEIVYGDVREPFTVENIKDNRYEISSPVLSTGGRHLISLNTLTDSKGCVQLLKEPDLVIDVRKDRPTAGFHALDGVRNVTIAEGSEARLPLRLNGEGPFEVTYRNVKTGQQYIATVRSNNGELVVEDNGQYELLGIKDPYCRGNVRPEEKDFWVDYLPRPLARIGEAAGNLSGSVYRRAPVCEGTSDAFEIFFEGEAPYTVGYEITGKSRSQKKIDSALPRAMVPLVREAGVWRYHFKDVSDANYPVSSKIDHSEMVEQEVWPRPTAVFKRNTKTRNYCLNDVIGRSSDAATEDIELILEGEAPFDVTLQLQDLELNRAETKVFHIKDNTHKLDVADWKLSSIGAYMLHIIDIRDARGCGRQYSAGKGKESSIKLDVAEIAAIMPLISSVDQCVGDTIEFALAGTAPWSITYSFEGKEKVVSGLTSPRFSRIAQQPGRMQIHSVSHQKRRCETSVSGLYKVIHDIPSVKVSDITEDIEEGSSAEVTFDLIGTPPFTFTYTRSDASGHAILETHTVTGLEDRRYTIYAAEEGMFQTTYVKDKYCEYPRSGIAGQHQGAPLRIQNSRAPRIKDDDEDKNDDKYDSETRYIEFRQEL